MQPLARATGPAAASAAELGSGAFAALEEAAVAPADVFFHRFYNLQSQKARRAAKEEKKGDERECFFGTQLAAVT